MNTKESLKTYTLRPVQLEGWNLQVGVFAPGDGLLYVGKSPNVGCLTRGNDVSICDSTGSLLVTGEDRPYKRWYAPDHVLMRDGNDMCTIRQTRFFTFERLLLFTNGEHCSFSSSYPSERGRSNGDWRYEVTVDEKHWKVSLWGLPDDLMLLSALIYFYRGWRLSSYDSI